MKRLFLLFLMFLLLTGSADAFSIKKPDIKLPKIKLPSIKIPVITKKGVVIPQGQGYAGELPDIDRYFQYKQPNAKSPAQDKILNGPVRRGNLMDAPLDDSIFLDVIVKKDPASKYVNDLQPIVPILLEFRKSIEKKEDIQRFNSHVNVFDLYARNLERLYGDKKEANSPSYQTLMELNYRSKLLGNLKFDAAYYSKYMPVLDEAYTPQGIAKQDAIMIQEIDRTIDIVKKAR